MVDRITISVYGWMNRELRERQTDGKSEHIREALVARWAAEDAGDWDAPGVDPAAVDLKPESKGAVPDGG